MIIQCFALKLTFSHKKLYSRFHYFQLFIGADFCEAFEVFAQIFEIHSFFISIKLISILKFRCLRK